IAPLAPATKMFIAVSCGVTVSPGLLLLQLGNGHLLGVRPRSRVTRAHGGPESDGFHGPPFGSSKCSRAVPTHEPYSLRFSRIVGSSISRGCKVTATRRVRVLALGFRATRCRLP